MIIIITKRGGGKTTQLIRESAKTGYPIVCLHYQELKRILEQSLVDGVVIPTPITFTEFRTGAYASRVEIEGLLIDNADLLLQSLALVPIRGVSMSSDCHENGKEASNE